MPGAKGGSFQVVCDGCGKTFGKRYPDLGEARVTFFAHEDDAANTAVEAGWWVELIDEKAICPKCRDADLDTGEIGEPIL